MPSFLKRAKEAFLRKFSSRRQRSRSRLTTLKRKNRPEIPELDPLYKKPSTEELEDSICMPRQTFDVRLKELEGNGRFVEIREIDKVPVEFEFRHEINGNFTLRMSATAIETTAITGLEHKNRAELWLTIYDPRHQVSREYIVEAFHKGKMLYSKESCSEPFEQNLLIIGQELESDWQSILMSLDYIRFINPLMDEVSITYSENQTQTDHGQLVAAVSDEAVVDLPESELSTLHLETILEEQSNDDQQVAAVLNDAFILPPDSELSSFNLTRKSEKEFITVKKSSPSTRIHSRHKNLLSSTDVSAMLVLVFLMGFVTRMIL